MYIEHGSMLVLCTYHLSTPACLYLYALTTSTTYRTERNLNFPDWAGHLHLGHDLGSHATPRLSLVRALSDSSAAAAREIKLEVDQPFAHLVDPIARA